MPSRNVIKEYTTDAYYHAYNRGVAKQPIFLDATDKKKFLQIMARHLDPSDKSFRGDGTFYKKFDDDLELTCYCLMRNHFHLLFYIKGDPSSLRFFMQSVLTAYSMYFNLRHKRVGTLFQGVFKAAKIDSDDYLLHISRYIHLNPKNHAAHRYSSYQYYIGASPAAWIKPDRILGLFDSTMEYQTFLEDYQDYAATLDEIKYQLASEI
jgi:putative transposase